MTSEVKDVESLIKFEYRFKENIKQHREYLADRKYLMVKFTERYLSDAPDDTELESVTLFPVERAGKSGSEVFYLDVRIKNLDYPRRFIAKFQNIKNTKREHASSFKASTAQMATAVTKFELVDKDLGMLICDLARVGNHIEFRNFFLSDTSTENCEYALVSAFKFIGRNPNPTASEEYLFYSDYKRYVERSTMPLERLKAMRSGRATNIGLQEVAQQIVKHHDDILAAFNFKIVPYLVHGDLHARNLIVNSEDPTRTELIDFGWVNYGHPAKDFVLMEATLKFMLLHEFLGALTKKNKISLHLSVATYERFEEFLCNHGLQLPEVDDFKGFLRDLGEPHELHELQKDALVRVYTCLRVVRNSANALLSQYCNEYMEGENKSAERHYFVSLFLVVLGLSGMSEMEPIWTLLGLQKMGARIWTS